MAIPVAAAAALKAAAQTAAKQAAKKAAVDAAGRAVRGGPASGGGGSGGLVAMIAAPIAFIVVVVMGISMMTITTAATGAGAFLGIFGGHAVSCDTSAGSGTPSPEALADIPAVALQAYQTAGQKTGVDWAWIAGIGKIESNHGRFGGSVLGTDGVARPGIYGPRLDGTGVGGNWTPFYDTDNGVYDGDKVYDRAVGVVQFIPQTWVRYMQDGNGDGVKDPQNVWDGALATGTYLVASGAPADMKAAVWAYNRSEQYYLDVKSWRDKYTTAAADSGGTLPIGGDPGAGIPVSGWVHPLPVGEHNGPGSRFGMRFHPTLHVWRMHNGLDFGAPSGTRLFSGAAGKVTFSGWSTGGGWQVKIQHANGILTESMHMVRKSDLVAGQMVEAGTVIGYVGSTGYSTGPHLHYGVKRNGVYIDPLPFMQSVGVDPWGGYDGSGTTAAILNASTGCSTAAFPGVTSETTRAALTYALAQVGKPYVWGAEGPDAFDCSGLTSAAYLKAGIAIPRTAATQKMWSGMMEVPRGQEQPGDFIFWTNADTYPERAIFHVALVVDPTKKLMVEAANPSVGVRTRTYTWDAGSYDANNNISFGRIKAPESPTV